jgi:catechol 2,3-dioxygenase-like lactoylglutathione lyase family enzyme
MNLEVVVIPVSDVERAKQFYDSLGWRLDVDRAPPTTSARFSSRLRAPVARSRALSLSSLRTHMPWARRSDPESPPPADLLLVCRLLARGAAG